MTLEEKLEKFLNGINEWASGHNIVYSSQSLFNKPEEIETILNIDGSDLKNFSVDECRDAMLTLNRYLSYLNLVLSREKSAKSWSDQGLNYLLAGKDFSPYVKWEEKKALILREGSIAAKLQELKTVCEGRIMTIEAQIKNTEYILKIIEQVWRNKSYDRS